MSIERPPPGAAARVRRAWSAGRRHTALVTGSAGFLLANSVAGLVIARELGPAGRGEVSYSFLLMSAASTLGTFGLDYAATHLLAPTEAVSRRTAWRLWGLTTLSGLVAGLVVTGAALALRTPLNAAAVVVGTVGFTLATVAPAGAVARRRSGLVAVTRPLVAIVYLLVVIALLASGWWSGWLVWAWAGVGWGIAAVCAAVVTRGLPPGSADQRVRLGELHRDGRANWQSSLAQVVNYRFDQVVVLLSAGAAALGRYSLGVYLMSVLLIVADGSAELELPSLTSLGWAQRLARVRRVATWVAAIVGGLAVATVVVTAIAIRPVLGQGYGPVPLLTLLLLPGTVAAAAGKLASAALVAGRRARDVRRVTARTAIAVLVVTPPVVVLGGVYGAAVLATLVYAAIAVQLWSALQAVVREDAAGA